MADEAPTTPETTTAAETVAEAVEETVPASRFAEVAKHKKAADAKVKDLERQMRELQASLEDREHAGLPELERERKAREKLEQQLAQERQERESFQQEAARVRAESWVARAAADVFADPEDAILRINASEIETPDDAERAVKQLAKNPKYKRLLKQEEPQLPGQRIGGGAPVAQQQRVPGASAAGSALGLVNTEEEAQAVAQALEQFRKTRARTTINFDGT